MKRLIKYVIISSFAACAALSAQSRLKVGLVPDTGTINDGSFNQGTWEGVVRASKDFQIECEYRTPAANNDEAYFVQIEDLINDGCQMVICPGFTFETTIFAAQHRWPDVKFVLIDGTPHNEDYSVFETADNTVGITWMEHESGFVAGIAAAVHIFNGKAGFIGGMEIPAVQRYNWGWQRGIAYANWQYGTNVTVEKEDVVYQGTFTDIVDGQRIAAEMYDRGVRCIFAAAGAVGLGVIDEAKKRRGRMTDEEIQKSFDLSTAMADRSKGITFWQGVQEALGIEVHKEETKKELTRVSADDVWVVGVDIDQYEVGMMNTGHSAVLTTAQKDVGLASYQMIKDVLANHFKGGQNIELSARTGGVGIPVNNPNLSKDAQSKSQLALKHMSYNVVKVRGDSEGLIK